MNEYKVLVTGQDGIGYSFMKNVIELANLGAVLEDKKVPAMSFPYSCWMYLKTDELMVNKPGFQFQIMQEIFTKDQLDDMDWDTLKATVKKKYGISGRDRNLLVTQYLKASGQVESSKEEK
jgi:hypothetical protein